MKNAIRILTILSIFVGVIGFVVGQLLTAMYCFDYCAPTAFSDIPILDGCAFSPYIIMILVGYFLFLKAARHNMMPLLYFGVLSLFLLGVLIFTTIMIHINNQSVDEYGVWGKVNKIITPSLICSAVLPIALFIGTFLLPDSEKSITDVSAM